jgi:hypothetical protein
VRTIVIGDIHQRINSVKAILDAEKNYDEVVFLGDVFDSFFEPPRVAGFEETCDYLRHLVLEHPQKEKFVFLLGNHDVSYIYENKDFSDKRISKTLKYFCSGFTTSKAKKFRHAFFDKGLKDDFFIKHFKLAHRSQGWTFSHAGIMPDHFPYGYDIDRFVNELLPDVWKNFRNLEYNHNWLLSGAGYCRGGTHKVGGVLWCDWNMEFKASDKIGKQVLGHTTVREPAVEAMNTDYETWNLDTEKDYGIILNERFSSKLIPIKEDKTKNLSSRVQHFIEHETLRWDEPAQ